MAKAKVYTLEGKQAGEQALNDNVFAAEAKPFATHQNVKVYLANQRQGTHSTLTRAEVSGGGSAAKTTVAGSGASGLAFGSKSLSWSVMDRCSGNAAPEVALCMLGAMLLEVPAAVVGGQRQFRLAAR